MVTSKDVARSAGVSQATVSRVFRETGSVTSATEQRVRAAALELKYRPSEAARALVAGQNRQIALVVEALTQPAFSLIADLAHRRLLELGYRLTIVESDASGGGLRSVSARQFGGADGVLFASSEREGQLHETFALIDRPLVLVMRESSSVKFDGVYPDHMSGAELAIDHLWSLGHRGIAMIGGTDRITHGYKTAQGFKDAMRRRGVAEPIILTGGLGYEQGREQALQLLKLKNPPTAIFAADDPGAYGAIDAARELGLAVPDDLSVVGFDDFDSSAWKAFDLTTVRIDHEQIVSRAVAILVRRIQEYGHEKDRSPVADEMIPVSLTVRGSTARIPDFA